MLDLEQVVQFLDCDPKQFESVFEAQFLLPPDLDTALPLWRLVALSDGMVIFAFDHVVADGKSGVAFHRMLSASLNKHSRCPTPPTMDTTVSPVPDLALIPPMEATIPAPFPLWLIARELLNTLNLFAW